MMDIAPVAALHPGAGSMPMVEIINNEYRCIPCVAICNTRQMLDAHLAGRKHVAKINLCGGEANFKSIAEIPELPPTQTLTPAGKKRKNKDRGDAPTATIDCDLCSVSTPNKDHYDSHVNGKKHLAKVAKLDQSAGGDSAAPTVFRCEECNIGTTNAEALELHRQGKKHMAKVAKGPAETFHCEFCNVTVNNQAIFEAHRNGKKHAEKVRKIAEGEAGTAQKELTCDVCQVTMHGQAAMDAHLIGKKHLKKAGGDENAKPPTEMLTCEPCGVSVNCQQMMDGHMQGKKHQKKVGGGEAPAAPSIAEPSPKKKKYDPAELFCNVCSLQVTSPQIMASHLAGKSHGKKMVAVNQENASALATSLIQSVRSETEGDALMTDVEGVKPLNGTSNPAAAKEEPKVIPNVAAVAASPARGSLSRRPN